MKNICFRDEHPECDLDCEGNRVVVEQLHSARETVVRIQRLENRTRLELHYVGQDNTRIKLNVKRKR